MRHRMTGIKFEKATFILSTKEKLPIRHTAVSGIFMLISCVYIAFILYLSCATPLSPAMHTQSGNKIDTTQAHDNFPFVYDTLPTAAFTETVQIHRRPYILCLSCALLVSILCHNTHRQTRHPIPPTTPPTTPPPCLTNLFPKYRKYPRCIVRPHRPTDDSSSNTHNSPHTFHIYIVPIICFSCVYLVSLHTAAYTLPEPIRRR